MSPTHLLDAAMGCFASQQHGKPARGTSGGKVGIVDGAVVVVCDTLHCSASFLLTHLIRTHLQPHHQPPHSASLSPSSSSSSSCGVSRVCLVAVAEAPTHYLTILRKMGCNPTPLLNSGRLVIVDALSAPPTPQLRQETDARSDRGSRVLADLYARIRESLDRAAVAAASSSAPAAPPPSKAGGLPSASQAEPETAAAAAVIETTTATEAVAPIVAAAAAAAGIATSRLACSGAVPALASGAQEGNRECMDVDVDVDGGHPSTARKSDCDSQRTQVGTDSHCEGALCVVVDDVWALEAMAGGDSVAVEEFLLRYCRSLGGLCSRRGVHHRNSLVLLVHTDDDDSSDSDDGGDITLRNPLLPLALHAADVSVHVRGMRTGHADDLHGEAGVVHRSGRLVEAAGGQWVHPGILFHIRENGPHFFVV